MIFKPFSFDPFGNFVVYTIFVYDSMQDSWVSKKDQFWSLKSNMKVLKHNIFGLNKDLKS